LPQEVRQLELRVQSVAGIAQVLGDDRLKTEAFTQLTDQNQASIGGNARSLKRHLQKPVEGEVKRLGFFLTHRVSPFLAEFLLSEPAEIKAQRLFCEGEYHDQIGNPGSEVGIRPGPPRGHPAAASARRGAPTQCGSINSRHIAVRMQLRGHRSASGS
jgi:hypothetical protein